MDLAMRKTPPKSVVRESQAFLQRYAAERLRQRQASHAEASRRAERLRQLLFSGVSKDDPRLKKLKEQSRAAMQRRKQRKVVGPAPKLTPAKIKTPADA